MENLGNATGIEITFLSKIFVSNLFTLNPEYEAHIRNIFKSEVEIVDFSNILETIKMINNLVRCNFFYYDPIHRSCLSRSPAQFRNTCFTITTLAQFKQQAKTIGALYDGKIGAIFRLICRVRSEPNLFPIKIPLPYLKKIIKEK